MCFVWSVGSCRHYTISKENEGERLDGILEEDDLQHPHFLCTSQ